MGRLTTIVIARAIKPGMYPDGDGLYLQVTGSGARSWLYRFALNGKRRYLGLGSLKAIPLARARVLAAEARRLRAEGVDPVTQRREKRAAERVESAKAVTFKQCVESYIAAYEASWRNAKHRQQWRNTLATYVEPLLGGLPVQAVDTGLVMQVIEPLWANKPETASRIRGRIESILDWAKVRGFRDGENPARWRGHLDHLLPAKAKVRAVRHLAALPYTEIPVFMADLRRRTSISARCLEITILTALRTKAAIGAQWAEIDFTTEVWTVPGWRMKGGKEHRIPLSERVLDIFADLHQRREGEYVFPGMKPGQPLSNMAMLKMLALMDRDVTTHGFRSSFKDWCAETTDFPDWVSEKALAHTIGDETKRAYQRGDLLEKRRLLMTAWSEYCGESRDRVAPALATGAPT